MFTITTAIEVHDVEATAQLLCGLFGVRRAWMHGEPVAVGEVAITPWSGSAGLQLRRREGEVRATELTFEVGGWVDDIHARVQAAGLHVVEPPGDRPWGRRDFTFALEEGHRIGVSGATTPAHWAE